MDPFPFVAVSGDFTAGWTRKGYSTFFFRREHEAGFLVFVGGICTLGRIGDNRYLGNAPFPVASFCPSCARTGIFFFFFLLSSSVTGPPFFFFSRPRNASKRGFSRRGSFAGDPFFERRHGKTIPLLLLFFFLELTGDCCFLLFPFWCF